MNLSKHVMWRVNSIFNGTKQDLIKSIKYKLIIKLITHVDANWGIC
jgi:hypothetical protein